MASFCPNDHASNELSPLPFCLGACTTVRMELAARHVLRAIRGKRSQVAFSRRLGYRGNPIANWETGRRFPTALETLRICTVVGIDVQSAFMRFMRAPTASRVVVADLPGWLNEVRGSASLATIATRSGCSRFAIGRWLSGKTQPRLPDFLLLVEALTGRVSDLVAELVPIDLVPSLEPGYRARQAARNIAFEEPWTEAVLRVLETTKSTRGASCRWVARKLLLPDHVAKRCLEALERAQLVIKKGGCYRSAGTLTVDTKSAPDLMRNINAHWAQVAVDRSARADSKAWLAYNVFSLSLSDFEHVRSALRAGFREMRSIVAGSDANEVVGLATLQLVQLSGDLPE